MWDEIARSIDSQIERNGTKSLFYDGGNCKGIGCSEENYRLLTERRQDIFAFIEQIELRGYFDYFVGRLSDHVTRVLLQANQYLTADEAMRRTACAVYAQFVRDIKEMCADDTDRAAIDTVFSAHYDRLRHFLTGDKGTWTADEYAGTQEVQPRLCAVYSPQFQIDILGLNAAYIMPPVIDVGCGRDAALVRHLRQLGIEATGIDRDAGTGAHTVCDDYIDLEFKPDTYGTVISHMAFSNQLWYLKERSAKQLCKYERKFHEILASLKPGGCFVYMPGLPYLEETLPDGYTVQRVQISIGSARLYATHIRRSPASE